MAKHNLSGVYPRSGRLDEAIALFERTLTTETVRSAPIIPSLSSLRISSPSPIRPSGRRDEAIRLLERTLAARNAKLGRDHPATLITQNNLALAYDQAGDVARAEPLFREVLELRKKRRGSGHPHVAETLGDLGSHLIPHEEIRRGRDIPARGPDDLADQAPRRLDHVPDSELARREACRARRSSPRPSLCCSRATKG